MQVMLKSMPC